MNVSFWPPLQLLVNARIAREILYTFDSETLANGDFYNDQLKEKVSRIRLSVRPYVCSTCTNSTEHQKLLPLPTNIQTKLVYVALEIGLEIEKWFINHEGFLESRTNFIVRNILSWRSTGIIDRLETARGLIRNENLHIIYRFLFACEYYFEEDAQKLWTKMPEYYRIKYRMKWQREDMRHWLNALDNRTALDWEQISLNITGELFFISNAMGIPYFFPRLQGREIRYECILSGLELVKGSLRPFDLYICLHQLSADELNDVFTRLPKQILHIVFESFLNWPLQIMFLDVTDSFKTHIDGEIFLSLICVLLDILECGYEEYEYVDLLKSFWEAFSSQYSSFIEKNEILNKIVNYVLNAPLPFNVQDCGNFISNVRKKEIREVGGRKRTLLEIFNPWSVPTNLI
ncbi:uncharacterized protein NPIL_461991 [Nephila pilipes]|uniref:Uncharacterized protein n=1 Tax=Nephila pilipes TaxID=299642 RepID=A0A8X6QAU5_NEPPI|nr:uncharacterized protein NPIL_461991 [Nephila pilipes]